MAWNLFAKRESNTSSPAPEPTTESTTEPLNESSLDCAWCLGEQGIVPTSGSHGICGVHAAQMLEAAHSRSAQRSRRA
jgi:hypothetical protein